VAESLPLPSCSIKHQLATPKTKKLAPNDVAPNAFARKLCGFLIQQDIIFGTVLITDIIEVEDSYVFESIFVPMLMASSIAQAKISGQLPAFQPASSPPLSSPASISQS
jgi:hypothetical protein